MDYINYVTQSPMMGQIGLGGGATSLGRYGSSAGVWSGGDRGLFMGGLIIPTSPYHSNRIDYLAITSSTVAPVTKLTVSPSDAVKSRTSASLTPFI